MLGSLRHAWLALAALCATAQLSAAETSAGSVFMKARFQGPGTGILSRGAEDGHRGEGGVATAPASLFSGRAQHSLFAPRPRLDDHRGGALRPDAHGPRARIRHIIAQAEAGRDGYDAVQYAARIKPPALPTALSIAEIYDWIDATPGQHHAIGRYQFIPSTLRRLVRHLGIDPGTRFSPEVQDRLADQLLNEAGYAAHASGGMTRREFMGNLARIWAGLPTPSGKSYYHGYAGNKATMSWAQFEAEIAQAFPG